MAKFDPFSWPVDADSEMRIPERILNGGIAAFVFLLACWTLLSHFCVLFSFGFGVIYALSPLVPLAAILLWICWRHLELLHRARNAAISSAASRPGDRMAVWACSSAAPIVAYAATGNYSLFWWFAIGFLGVAGATQLSLRVSDREPPVFHWTGFVLLAALFGTASLIPIVAHRPDPDDALYVSIANSALEHPRIPVLRSDTLHDIPNLPILDVLYRVESWQLLEAFIARCFHLEPIVVAHLVLPPIWAGTSILAWATVLRALCPRAWPEALVSMFCVILFFAERHHSLGNFGFLRLQHGKSVALMLQLPLVYLFAWRYGTWGSRADLLLLGFGVIGGIGLSCTGLLMMPAAVLMGLASTFSFDGAWARRSAFGMVAAVYPLLAAWLLHPGLDTLAASLKDWPLETLGQILSDVFGPYGRYAILWSIMTSWVFVRSPMPRKWMLLGGIIVFLGIFNPYLTPFIKLHVTSAPAFWRVAWLYPSAIALSVAIAELGCRPRRIVFRLVSYCFLLALGLFLAERMGGFALRTSNGTFWGFGKLDIPAAEYDASREIAKLAPKESAAVVPETVAPWLETMPEHPKLVYVRRHYLLYFEPTLGRDEVERRLKIWSLINEEKSGVSPDYLLREIQPLNIGCITLDLRKTVAPAVGSMLEGLGWSHTVSGHYVIWIRPS